MPAHIAELLMSRFQIRHPIAWACLLLTGVIVFTSPWWWQKLLALPCGSIVAVISISVSARAERHKLLFSWIESLTAQRNMTQELIPYLDPVRASNRTGQIVYQFIRPPTPQGASAMTTTLEELIASFLQVGLSKIDTKLSPSTQQLIDTAVPTLVSTIASVIVDLAESHKAAKGSQAAK
jgi:hypothetical protein